MGVSRMSLQLRVTKRQLADLKQISELGTDRLREVQRTLCETKRPLLRPSELVESLRGTLGEDAELLARQLLSLHGLVRRSGSSVEEVFSAIQRAVEQQGEEVGILAHDWVDVSDIVQELVQDQNVRLASTAIELAYDYANLLQRTKILTDIRPVFNEAADEIEAAVVSYTLRLRYDSADGEHELSIAFDESDIKTLIDQCRRALAKATTAHAMLAEKCNVSVVISGEANDA